MRDGIRGLCSLLTGLGVGLLVAGLASPRSGAANRKLIQRKSEKARRLLKNTIQERAQYLTRRGTEMLDEASELMEQGKAAYRAASEKLAHAAL